MTKVKANFTRDFEQLITEMGDENGVNFRRDLPPGTASWLLHEEHKQICHLQFVCPCGCGAVVLLPVSATGEGGWQWDGNVNLPTLAPSIQRTSGCKWHGYLRRGVFESV